MQSTEKDQLFMGLAIELAHTAYENDEVPVGAVIVQRRNSEVLSAFSNQMRATKSSINHAEMLAIQKAMDLIKNERLIGCDMYVNDAFSCSHRNHSSITGVTDFLPSFFALFICIGCGISSIGIISKNLFSASIYHGKLGHYSGSKGLSVPVPLFILI